MPHPLTIDQHGLAGDGQHGRFGTCTACKRRNKVVTFGADPVCVMPQNVAYLKPDQRPESGCDAQRGPRPTRRGMR